MNDEWKPDLSSARFDAGGIYFEAEVGDHRLSYWIAPKFLDGSGEADRLLARALASLGDILSQMKNTGPHIRRLT